MGVVWVPWHRSLHSFRSVPNAEREAPRSCMSGYTASIQVTARFLSRYASSFCVQLIT